MGGNASQGGTSGNKNSSVTMMDVDAFGGVVTNIENILTPRQKRRLSQTLKKKDKSNIPLTVKRSSFLNRGTPQLIAPNKKKAWKQGFMTRSHSTKARGVAFS